MTKEQRFKGVMTDKYRLIFEAHEHIPAMQELLGKYYAELPGTSLKVLEVGCGDGYTTAILLNSRDNPLTAIDSEPQMVANLKQNINDLRLTAITADVGSFLEAHHDYDVIISAMTLHNLQKDLRSRAHQLIFKALKPGAVFLELDKFYPANNAKQLVFDRIALYIDLFSKKQEFEFLKEWVLHELDDSWPERAQYEAEVLCELKNIGFSSVTFKDRNNLEAILIAKKDI